MKENKYRNSTLEVVGVLSLACSSVAFLAGIRSEGVISYALIATFVVLTCIGYLLLRTVEGRRERESLKAVLGDQLHKALRKELPNLKNIAGSPVSDSRKVTDRDIKRLRMYLQDNKWELVSQDKNSATYVKGKYDVLVPLRTSLIDTDRRLKETAKVVLHSIGVKEPSALEKMWSIVYSGE